VSSIYSCLQWYENGKINQGNTRAIVEHKVARFYGSRCISSHTQGSNLLSFNVNIFSFNFGLPCEFELLFWCFLFPTNTLSWALLLMPVLLFRNVGILLVNYSILWWRDFHVLHPVLLTRVLHSSFHSYVGDFFWRECSKGNAVLGRERGSA